MNIKNEIQEQIKNEKVVLYMKGNPTSPMCGFSAKAVRVLQLCGVEEFKSYNILENNELRQGIKDFSNWPTIPQLYIKGQFIGGCDIMIEMYQSGELQKVLENKDI